MTTSSPTASETLYSQTSQNPPSTEQAQGRSGAAVGEGAVGATAIPLPQDGKWAPEALKALGIPEKPEGYTLERPQLPDGMPYDEAFEGEMRGAAHELGVAPWQLQGLLNRYADYASRQFGDIAKLGETARADAERQLQKEWGRDFDLKLGFARRTVATFGGAQAIADLNTSGLGNHPALIRMLATIGESLSEDSLVQGDKGGGHSKRDPASVLYGS